MEEFSEAAKQEFWSQFRDDASAAQTLLYRHEHGGVLVYDACARLASQDVQSAALATNTCSPQLLRELETAGEYGTS